MSVWQEKVPRKSREEESVIPLPATFVPSVENNDEVAPGCLFLLTGVMRFVLTLAEISQRLQPPTSSQRLRQSRRLFIIPLPFRCLPSRRRFLAFGNF